MAETITNPPFIGIYNFRDVGRVINSFDSHQTLDGSEVGKFNRLPRMKEGKLLRSGRLDEATTEDTQLMIDNYHLKTVIDLRTKSELLKRKEIFRDQGKECKETHWKRRWDTVKINFIGRKFEVNLLRQLRWWQALWFIVLMLFQQRMAAIRILGRNVMKPRGLVGLSKDSLRFCQDEILQTLEVYLDPQAYPVLVHCTQGKDRSGLIVMLILFILRIPLDLIKTDYVLSNQGLERVRESMIDEVLEIGMDEKYTQAPKAVVDEVWNFLEEGGGVDVYLDELGFGESKRQKVRDLLLE
ncbi:protein-tyrosine phosphatase-like protein [Lentinula aciculospora]|uniref:Protein-tyrosine phosphatase-like protein n=1 Tax=Lentinula aciculospora TaxID=153920 RepID=A0A9W9AM51_9AGAR|nr:protein-tyrosine phosphatase-like protein [Lentinula aciculospora]